MAIITVLRLQTLVGKPTGKIYPGLDLLGPGCKEVSSDVSISATLQNSKTDRQTDRQASSSRKNQFKTQRKVDLINVYASGQ